MKKKIFSLICLALAAITTSASIVRDDMAGRSTQDTDPGNEIVEVAYLESTGTQYLLFPDYINGIDCYILPQNNWTYSDGQSVGRFNGGSRCDGIAFGRQNKDGILIRNGNNSSCITTYDMSRDHLFHVVVHGTAVEVDDIAYTMGAAWGAFFRNQPFALFGSYRTDTKEVQTQSCCIGRCALYIGDTLLYDLIPMRKGSEGFFYDLVSETIFENQGTGSFLLGPDIAPLEL